MNKIFKITNLLITGLVLTVLIATPVSAQTTTTTTTPTTTKAAANIQKMIQRSDTAITQRINSLNALVSRVNAMKKLSDTEKSSLATSLQNEASQLATLKTTIDADTVASTLKTDMQSITKSYRIYMLVMPQATIAAASDRVLTIVDTMNAVVTKLQTRISQLPSGTDLTSIQSAMSDIAAKLSDATTQANAAVSEISSLVPDQGNTAAAAANTAALKDARSKIRVATSDLVAARKDMGTIVQDIKGIKGTNATPSTSAAQ